MIRAVFVLFWGLLVTMVLTMVLRSLLASARLPRAPRRRVPDELVKDPVCQAYIVRSRALARVQNGVLRHFCSPECARQFEHGGSQSRG